MTLRGLDLFAGSGGVSVGLARAGFTMFGVDNDPTRLAQYPFDSYLGDALEFAYRHADSYDFVTASPTCWGYTRGTVALPDRLQRYDRLIATTREVLTEICTPNGIPFMIENVEDARPEMLNTIRLCGRMSEFNLHATDTDGTPLVMDRHRLFEPHGVTLTAPPHHKHDRNIQVAGAYGGARRDKWEARYVRKGGYVPADLSVISELLGIDWMDEKGMFLSIPPVYTEFIGKQVYQQITER